MDIGKMTMSEAYPYLRIIADELDLKLNRYTEFKLARMILATRL